MTRLETLLTELDELKPDELELVLRKIKKKMNRKKRAESALNQYIGKGDGLWRIDPQEYVEKLREEERVVK